MSQALPAWGSLRVVRALPGGNRGHAFLVAAAEGHDGPAGPAGAREAAGRYVAKVTTRQPDAVAWAAASALRARRAGLGAPGYLPAPGGRWVVGGVTLQPFVAGRPATVAERRAALARLRSFHAAGVGQRQRPGFASSIALLRRRQGGDVDLDVMPHDLVRLCRDAWRPFRDRPRAAIHGDLNADNVLVDRHGKVVLLDWDECRVDVPLFDVAAWLDEANRAQATQPGRPEGQPVGRRGRGAAAGADAVRRARLAWEVAVCWTLEPQHARRVARTLGWPGDGHDAPDPAGAGC